MLRSCSERVLFCCVNAVQWYSQFNASGHVSGDVLIDNAMFSKLARECGLVSRRCSASDVDVTFAKVGKSVFECSYELTHLGQECETLYCVHLVAIVVTCSASQLGSESSHSTSFKPLSA